MRSDRPWKAFARGALAAHQILAVTNGGLFNVKDHGRRQVRGLFRIHGFRSRGASLSLGSGYINTGLNLACFHLIEIGRGVQIAENISIRDSDNHPVVGNQRTKPIRIGDHVWIGMNTTILKGVSVGNGAVIAPGSVVVRDVPARSLVAGVPAVVKKTDIDWVN